MIYIIHTCVDCAYMHSYEYIHDACHIYMHMWIVTCTDSMYAYFGIYILILNLIIYHKHFLHQKVVIISITVNDYIIFYHMKSLFNQAPDVENLSHHLCHHKMLGKTDFVIYICILSFSLLLHFFFFFLFLVYKYNNKN